MEYYIGVISRKYSLNNIIIDVVSIGKDIAYGSRSIFCFPGWRFNTWLQ